MIYQYRYYCDGHSMNNPQPGNEVGITFTNLVTGSIFNERTPISRIGVQAPPGTKFYINNSIYPMEVGVSGILELDMGEGAKIYALRFDKRTLESFADIKTLGLLIDIEYGGN